MTKIQIRKVNGVPMGRPCNPHPKQRQIEFEPPIYTVNQNWKDFEQSVTEHEAPGFEEGEAEGDLQWQAKNPVNDTWFDCGAAYLAAETRQIWIVPTPEKVEVKESKAQSWHPIEYAGQWNLNDEPFYEANNVMSADDVGYEQAQSNAQLASLAPELLNVCKKALFELIRLKKYTDQPLIDELTTVISNSPPTH